MEVVVTTGVWSYKSCKAPAKSSPPTNQHPFLQAGCPSCHPTNSVKALKGKISHSMDLLTPSSPGGLPTLCLTTNSSWLPRGRVAMTLISPLMPVPHHCGIYTAILTPPLFPCRAVLTRVQLRTCAFCYAIYTNVNLDCHEIWPTLSANSAAEERTVPKKRRRFCRLGKRTLSPANNEHTSSVQSWC